MKYWVGVTDNSWFEYLRQRQPDEVNFWQPSGKAPFSHLPAGAPFLFKVKRPYNHIAGGGYFVRFTTLPISLTWDVFAEKNGAETRRAFEALIRPKMPNREARDPEVGCTVLTMPFFWPKEKWIPAPESWAGNIVTGRYFDTQTSEGARLLAAVQANLAEELGVAEPEHRYGEPTLFRPRLGQGAFRVLVTDAYQRRCAITGEATLPVLEAAHIKPFAEEGPNSVSNGLLLRADFHKLFDAGLVTVTPSLVVEVSSRIREEWFNGKAYYRLHGQRLAVVPDVNDYRPSEALLAWHNENRFER